MFSGIRQSLARRDEAQKQARIRNARELMRRSRRRMKGYRAYQDIEAELGGQVQDEHAARSAAFEAHQSRQRHERNLKRLHRRTSSSGIATRALGRAAKDVFIRVPAKVLRSGAKLSKSGNIDRLLMGPTDMLFGSPQRLRNQNLNSFMFGPPSEQPTKRETKDAFEIDKDILS